VAGQLQQAGQAQQVVDAYRQHRSEAPRTPPRSAAC
jgi:hypothetical protein